MGERFRAATGRNLVSAVSAAGSLAIPARTALEPDVSVTSDTLAKALSGVAYDVSMLEEVTEALDRRLGPITDYPGPEDAHEKSVDEPKPADEKVVWRVEGLDRRLSRVHSRLADILNRLHI